MISYIAKSKDMNIVANSQSGGMFTVFAMYVLKNNGVVYGCSLTNDFVAIHKRVDNINNLDLLKKSKYIQSKLSNTYNEVKNDLVNKKMVLFSGTSCQIMGLKKYLGIEYESLILVDIVCHGVPSPKVFKDYISWQERKNAIKVKKVNFRNKYKYGWHSHIETLYAEDGREIDSDIFATLFYRHNILRPSCFKCKYKSIEHPSDITISDAWGVDKVEKDFDDNKGVSLVLLNTHKGEKLFTDIKEGILYKNVNILDFLQPPLISPFDEPKERNRFWHDYKRKSFEYIVGKYYEESIVKRIIKKFKRFYKNFIKKD